MESCRKTAVVATPITISTPTEESDFSHSHSSSVSQLSPTSVLVPPPRHPVVLSPCAACKILRRRCIENCMLAPYFPPTDPHKFTIAHRVFGASNIIKLLQELPESRRADAVSSMVYEANARLRDPVYGCAGTICQLQKQVNELQAELAKAQAEMVNLQCRHSNILTLIRMQMEKLPSLPLSPPLQPQNTYENLTFFDDNANFASLDRLWT
ncbi:putative transcription factor AS2-LOB family [Helianthus annuus]|uniref:Putative LOB domain-containing protein n=1 Tax=Helianthus annuus TaxID=4232 RepID=A0A251T2Q8_HELAN|nr:LOB domain-containing protein 1 [Helianthus annuus]KAF5777932.1 putative transcription factor AS2-LOB family [Helianthus annuus]KAJ0489401.1 putative transcription factor AS2-LOB family [Helianthus annuus]KAJ0674964.1 putative transcription factor AS2-LOB family [Helianthus annuus]